MSDHYVDVPLPLDEVERVEPPAVAEPPTVLIEGDVSLRQSFKLDLRLAILNYLDDFKRTPSEYNVDPRDGSYFEGKISAFVCGLLDEGVEFLPMSHAGLVFDPFCDPDYNWRFSVEEEQKIMDWLVETGRWSVEEEIAMLAESGRLASLKPVRPVGVSDVTNPDLL